MKKTKLFLAAIPVLFLITLFSCNPTVNDSVAKADSINESKINANDSTMGINVNEETAKFIVNAMNGGMTEIKLAEIASKKAHVKGIRSFADSLAKDHSYANKELRLIAAEKNITVPIQVGDESEKEASDMKRMLGKNFDRAYIDTMVMAHKEAIAMFKDAREKSNDSDVVAFISKTLPKLESHLNEAMELQEKMN